MHITKPIDLGLLAKELTTAGVPFNELGYSGTATDAELFTYDSDGVPTELPPEAQPIVDAHDATAPQRTKTFEASEDAERLALVAERSLDDPAFAALAELALRTKQGG